MWKLIKYEFKKIFKNKMNILLSILVFGTCFYMAIDQTIHYYSDSLHEYINEKGEQMNSIEIYRYMDSFQREHEGKVTTEYANRMNQLFDTMIQENHSDEFDEKWMIKNYGKDYKEFLNKLDNNTITKNEAYDYIYEIDDDNYPPDIRYDGEKWDYEIRTKSTGYENLIKLVKKSFNYNDLMILKNNKITKEKINGIDENSGYNEFYSNLIKMSESDQNKSIEYLNEKIDNLQMECSSTVGAQILYRICAGGVNLFPYMMLLVLVMILCSNIFSREKQVESILLTSKKGYKQVTIAKIITALIISMGSIALYYLGVFAFVRWIVPIDHLNYIINDYYISVNTYQEALFNAMTSVFCASTVSAIIAIFLSCMTKNSFVTIIPLLLGNFIFGIFGAFINSIYISSVPFMMINVMNCELWYRYISNDVVFNFIRVGNSYMYINVFICVVWLVILVILGLLCYFKQKRHIVR